MIVRRGADVVVRFRAVRVVPFNRWFRATTVRVRAVRVFVVEVFFHVRSVNDGVGRAHLIVCFRSFLRIPKAFYSAVFRVALVVVWVGIYPAVALAPLGGFLSAVRSSWEADFLVNVRPFLCC